MAVIATALAACMSIFPARAARAGNMGHLLQSYESWLRSAAAQAQGLTIEYREDADVRAVLGLQCTVYDQASPMNALAHVSEMFRPSAP
jgi:hypothetical protein